MAKSFTWKGLKYFGLVLPLYPLPYLAVSSREPDQRLVLSETLEQLAKHLLVNVRDVVQVQILHLLVIL